MINVKNKSKIAATKPFTGASLKKKPEFEAVASKNLRLKPNFWRRRALLATESSDGKQRLLSEFLIDGLATTNEGGTSGLGDL